MGDAESPLRSVERALQLDPDFVEALVLRASLLYVRGEARLALSDATRAAEREPRNTQALAILAQVQAALGQVEKSRETQARRRQVVAELERIAELTHQIAEAPDDPVPRWRLGQLAAATGAEGLARESFRAALLRDRLCQPALEGLRSLNGNSPPYPLSTASSLRLLARPSAGR